MSTDTAISHVSSSYAASNSGKYSVGFARCTFVDRSRSVLDYATNPPSVLSSQRRLVTEIRYPSAMPSARTVATPGALAAIRAGGFPMIVFVHGYDVQPSIYSALLDAWASKGFVVASPIFPDESAAGVAHQHGANTEADLVNEPADVAFVTRQLTNDSASETPSCLILFGLIDSSALALAGHSDGAAAVGMLSYSSGNDPQGVAYSTLRSLSHFRATIIMEGDEGGHAAYRSSTFSPDLLVIQSAQDHCNSAQGALRMYRDVQQSNKWFLELRSAHHMPPFDGVDKRAFASVVATTSLFFQMSLQEIATATQLLKTGNAQPSTARLFHAGAGPTIDPLTSYYCGFT